MVGRVKQFDIPKGFGFITTAEGEDVFVHFSQIKNQDGRFKKLSAGQSVKFDVQDSGKPAREAVDVVATSPFVSQD